jgi:hypothetical protein
MSKTPVVGNLGSGPLPPLLRRRLVPLWQHSDQAEVDVLVRQWARRLSSAPKEGTELL